MHTHKKTWSLRSLPKGLLYRRNRVTAHANSTSDKESANKTFRLKVAEVHYEFPLSVLSLFVWHAQVLIYRNPSV